MSDSCLRAKIEKGSQLKLTRCPPLYKGVDSQNVTGICLGRREPIKILSQETCSCQQLRQPTGCVREVNTLCFRDSYRFLILV